MSFISAQENKDAQGGGDNKVAEEPKSETTPNSDSDKNSNDPDQGKVRAKRKLVLSLTSNASAEIRAEYNLNAQFTIGTQFYKRLMQESTGTNIISNTIYMEENFYNRRGLELFGKYFLFKEGPVYLTLGAGKYLDSGATRNTLLITRNANSELLPKPEAITNTTTINPFWYIKYGAGFQWIFDFGLLVNIEANALSPINGKQKSYTYVDERNLLLNNYYTPVNVFVYDKYFKSIDQGARSLYQINIWLGYAFSI